MRTYSIYQKPCPACGTIASVDSKTCACGHSFDSVDEVGLPLEEQTLHEEELFQAYLSARVEQVVSMVELARAELLADMSNVQKADKLLRTVQDALALRDECDAQAAKIAHLRESLSIKVDTPVMTDQPTDSFRAKQSSKAEKIMEGYSNTQTKTCPHCHTVLPETSALCLCGFIFARNDFLLPRAADYSTTGELYRSK